MPDYLDSVERQLAQLTEQGAHRRLRARMPLPAAQGGRSVGVGDPGRPRGGGPRPRWRTETLAIGTAIGVVVAVVAIVLSVRSGPSHTTAAANGGHTTTHARAPARHHRATSPNTQHSTTAATTTPATVPGPSGGPVPSGFEPMSFTAISELTWWLIGTAPCSSGTCATVVRTTDGGRSFVSIPPPQAPFSYSKSNGVSQLRFADAQNGFAFTPGLQVTHNGGASWLPVELGGDVADVEIAGGRAYAYVSQGRDGKLLVASVGSNRFAMLSAAGDVSGGLWVHGEDVFIRSAAGSAIGNQLLVSHDAGASFARYPLPPSVACNVEELEPPVVWAPCATGMDSSVWRSTDSGKTFASAAGSGPAISSLPNSAAFGAASASTAVVGWQQLYRTGDGGTTYTKVGPSGIEDWLYLGFTDPTHGVALGQAGPNGSQTRLYYTTDGGISYHLVPIR